MGQPQLPQELIDIILSYINGIGNCQSCSLVCKDWSIVFQGRLFRRCNIPFPRVGLRHGECLPDPLPSYEGFQRLLDESPHLRTYIREIYMVDNASSQPWTSDRSLAFISLSQRLSNLEKLDFGQADWRVAPECVWASVLAAIERGRVSELRLKNCYFPDFPKFFHFLQAAKRLKKLTLDQSGVGVWDDNNSLDVDQIAMSCDMSGAPSTTTIEFLHFDCDFDTPITCLLHPRIKQAVDITRLQTLIYRKSRHYTFLATQLLPAVALNGTLRSLELQLTLATNLQSPIPLASLSTLQILKIRSQHSRHSDGGAWFASSFAGIHPAHALEEIFLQVEGIARDSDEEIDWTSWSALDDILRPPQFDNLHAVHVRILFQYQNSHIETLHARMQENFDKFVSLLPILQGAGFLKAELDLGRYSWCLDRDAVFNAASSI